MYVRRAIISVFDKTGIEKFAKGLKELGVEVLSTGGTAKVLKDANTEVTEISNYTGYPEILDGRLKTLHPMIHGGILGRRKDNSDAKQMKDHNIEPIDMVVVNFYPFESTVAQPGCSLEEAIENIDIGGPAMIRAAAKNYKDVAVIVDPADYGWVLNRLRVSGRSMSEEEVFQLAQKVFAYTARYDSLICNYLNAVDGGKKKDIFPNRIGFVMEKGQDLRYGENPHQKAAFYKEYGVEEPCIARAEQLHGKELSYNNIMDANAAIEVVKEFSNEVFAVVVKHSNPCGAAVSPNSLLDAFKKAEAADPVSAFGGIVGFNRQVDANVAEAISEGFFEVVVGPDFSDDALKVLRKKKNIRLLKVEGLGGKFVPKGWSTRKVVGGLLVQERDVIRTNIREGKVVTKRTPSEDEYRAMEFAWKICKFVKSNAVVFTTTDQVLGIGAGQMSRVDSVRIAEMKMKDMLRQKAGILAGQHTIVCASDAFFPFRDGVDAVAKAGAAAIVQPGGSMRDQECIDAANEHGIAMVFTGVRHFNH